jgi:hypothetical protein
LYERQTARVEETLNSNRNLQCNVQEENHGSVEPSIEVDISA